MSRRERLTDEQATFQIDASRDLHKIKRPRLFIYSLFAQIDSYHHSVS